MKKYFAVLLTVVGMAMADSAMAITWTKTTGHYTIYSDGGWATMPFSPPTTVPSTALIRSVTYTWNPYPNGNFLETVELCYSKPYSSTIGYCQDVTNSRTGTVSTFNGFSAKGSFWIRHTLRGGTYPAIFPSITDTVIVDYP